jgi:hypothetical protein
LKTINVGNLADLKAALRGLPPDLLFRGQTKHYDDSGLPSIKTTFEREGCIPSEMQRWSRYADKVLDAFHNEHGANLDLNHAILQHYGWRSFFVDCSSSDAVAAWFASHRYSDKLTGEICEDYEERPVILHKRMAEYSFEAGEGHLYAFDRNRVREAVGAIDLEALSVANAHPRMQAQKAWLIGPLGRKRISEDCFVAHIIADRKVFKEFAAEAGHTDTDTLFPSKDHDPILAALLGLPWRTLQKKGAKKFPIPIFRRALELPEYQESFVKISASSVAFFEGKTISTTLGTVDGAKDDCEAYSVPSNILYGSPDKTLPLRFPEVRKLLTRHKCVAFEVDDLVRHPNMGRMTLYQKGIAVWEHQENLVEVMELMVRHPGLDLKGAGFLPGWYFRIGTDGVWTRESNAKECDCNQSWPHEPHIAALRIVERFFSDPRDFAGMD